MAAKARFESYVEERMAEAAAGRRAKLKAEFDAEVAKAGKLRDKYLEMIEDGVEALVRTVVAQARRDGRDVNDAADMEKHLVLYAEGKVHAMVGLRPEYDHRSRESLWPEGTPARRAQDALRAFDALCAREATRIVVYKKDLGMKPEAFERMLAEAAEKINKE